MADASSQTVPIADTSALPIHLRYFTLLRSNANFRRLWIAQLISEIGDWFYSLAVYDLLLQVTGSGKAVGWAIIIQTLPWFFMTPLAGHLADRFSRRRLMILADLVRASVVLGLLLARSAADVWLVYVLLGFEEIFASIFEPARNALLPDVVTREEILPANAIGSGTWSLALAVGASLGGVVTALLGRRIAFVVNSLSFLVSASLVWRIRVRETHLEPVAAPDAEGTREGGLQSWREGARYLRQDPHVVALVLAKTILGCLGGMLLLLTVFGEKIFPLAGRGALAMGLLYGARGVGAGIGPFLGDLWTGGREAPMRRAIGFGFLIVGVAYLALSHAPNLALAILAIFLGQLGTSNVWVMSTTLLQQRVTDRFRGRVFSLDFGLMMLMISVSNFVVGKGLDDWSIPPRDLAAALGALVLIPGILWLMADTKWRWEARH